MNSRELKYWAIRKWRLIFKEGGKIYDEKLIKQLPELTEFNSHCSYCDIYIHICCSGCPLNTINSFFTFNFRILGCNKKKHPFKKWEDNPCEHTAWEVLCLIRKVKVDREELFFRENKNDKNKSKDSKKQS